MTSPGREKVDLVGALDDFEGMKPGLLVESDVLGTLFLVVLGKALAGEFVNESAGG